MGILKSVSIEIPSNIDDKNSIRIITGNDDEIEDDYISPGEKQQILDDLREKLRVSEAQSASGAPRISLDDAMEKLRNKRHERSL